jgi:hypothetical protein
MLSSLQYNYCCSNLHADTNPEMSLLERRNDKDRERTIKKYHGMTDEQKADRNARKQANRYRSIFDAGATIANNKGFFYQAIIILSNVVG